jgi:hypothetical protein
VSKQWGAVLRGDDADLQDWRVIFRPPFDPWVEVHGPDTVLRSASLDGLTSAGEVRDRIAAHIDRLNGVMLVMRQGSPLHFSGVVEFSPDGKLHRTVLVEGTMHVRAAFFASIVTGPSGKPEPPKPSEAQVWSAIADGDDLLEDALIYFGRVSAPDPGQHPPTFWFDIYKALECLFTKYGGGERPGASPPVRRGKSSGIPLELLLYRP